MFQPAMFICETVAFACDANYPNRLAGCICCWLLPTRCIPAPFPQQIMLNQDVLLRRPHARIVVTLLSDLLKFTTNHRRIQKANSAYSDPLKFVKLAFLLPPTLPKLLGAT